MNRKVVVALIILLSLGIVLTFVYIKYFNFKAISDVKTSFKISSGQVEAILWDNVTSDDFLNLLNNQQNQGVFSKISPSVLPIEKYRFPNPYFIQNHGFGYVELFLAQIQLGNYVDSNKQPYQTVKTYKININKEDYYLMIQRWINNDKSISFVSVITYTTPTSLIDGIAHTIYAFAINNPDGNNPLLIGSPKNMTCTPTCTVDLLPTSSSISLGSSTQLTASISDSFGTITQVNFSSSNSSLVSVSDPGYDTTSAYTTTATANSVGTATITASVVMSGAVRCTDD